MKRVWLKNIIAKVKDWSVRSDLFAKLSSVMYMSNDSDFTTMAESVTMAKEKLDALFALYPQCVDFILYF